MPLGPVPPSNAAQSPEAAPAADSQPDAQVAVAQSFNAELRSFLMDLIPEAGARVVFHDIAGNKHEAPAVLSGRRQFLLAVELEKLSGSVMSKLAAASSVQRGTSIATLAVVAARMFADPELQEALRLAFGIIHPKAVDKALSLGVIADTEEGDPRPPGAFEVFPAEEVVRAVIPFCLAPIRGIVETALAALDRMQREP